MIKQRFLGAEVVSSLLFLVIYLSSLSERTLRAADFPASDDQLMTSDTDASGRTSLRVIVFNAQLTPIVSTLFHPDFSPSGRAKELGRRLAEFDIIALNEVFDDDCRQRMVRELRKNWDSDPHTVVMSAGMRSRFGLDGGLMLLSRWPILESHSMTFGNDSRIADEGIFADEFAAKGALHARIRIPIPTQNDGPLVDVFVTHLDGRVQSIRDAQYDKLADFIRRHTAPDHVALLLGDLNTDGGVRTTTEPGEAYNRMLAILRSSRENHRLIDLWREYGQGAGGTSDLQDGVGQRLDYILLSTPVCSEHAKTWCPSSVRVDAMQVDHYGPLSDHSAVMAEWLLGDQVLDGLR